MSKDKTVNPAAAAEKTAAPAEAKPEEKAPAKPKVTVLKSEALLALADPLFAKSEAEPSLCGVNEIKLKMSHTERNMSCYIRHTRSGFLLQLPNNKLETIIGTDIKEYRTRETQRQTVYTFPDMDTLAAEFTKAGAKAKIAGPIAPKAKKAPADAKDGDAKPAKPAKGDAAAKPAKGDAPVT